MTSFAGEHHLVWRFLPMYNNRALAHTARGGGEMVDAADLKSAGVLPVWVRIPPALLTKDPAGFEILRGLLFG